MIAQTDVDLEDWIYGVIQNEPVKAGGFLHRVCYAAMAADDDNYALLRPVLLQFKAKYPGYSYKGEIGGCGSP